MDVVDGTGHVLVHLFFAVAVWPICIWYDMRHINVRTKAEGSHSIVQMYSAFGNMTSLRWCCGLIRRKEVSSYRFTVTVTIKVSFRISVRFRFSRGVATFSAWGGEQWYGAPMIIIIIIIIIIINDNVYGAVIVTMVCCHRDHGHCESSPGSFDECRLSAGWPPTHRPSQPTWAVSPDNSRYDSR